MLKSYKERLQTITRKNFREVALELFNYQKKNNSVYKHYITSVEQNRKSVDSLEQIPFLPISIFKYHAVKTGLWKEKMIFESSGTTGSKVSRHYIRDVEMYHTNSCNIFESFYGDAADYVILALLPSYLERKNSSLVNMLEMLIRKTSSEDSGFYLHNYDALAVRIRRIRRYTHKKVILWGVTYALTDFAEKFPMDLSGWIVMETGGMKGRKEEWVRQEVHTFLKKQLNVDRIHSEYGMTELLSQAYSKREGRFVTPAAMKLLIREINDPFSIDNTLRQGAINIIDLANLDTCAFIATDDLGRINADGTFEVLGRLDNADLRGCNFLLN